MKKKDLQNILLLCLTLLAALGILEIVLRQTHWLGARISWSNPDPLLGWRLAPGKDYWYVHENEHPVRFEINRFGWRDRDWSIEKPKQTARIALLGDSYVEALQVAREKTTAAIMEKEMTQRLGHSVEVMNFGRSCNTQSEELLILKKDILQFQPDVVVLFYFAINDIGDLAPSTSLSLMRPFYTVQADTGELQLDTHFQNSREYKIKKLINPLKHHSALISLLAERLIILQRIFYAQKNGIMTKETGAEGKLKGYLSLATQNPDSHYVRNYALSKRLLREMRQLCALHGIRFMLVNVDLPSYLPEEDDKFKKTDGSFNSHFFDQDLGAFAASEGILYLGLDLLFREHFLTTKRPLHFKYWDTMGTNGYWEYGAHTGHWNEEGHRLVALALSPVLEPLLRTSGPGQHIPTDS